MFPNNLYRHYDWRKIAKKFRRKRIRQSIAKKRDELLEKEQNEQNKSPTYQAWLEEEAKRKQFEIEEENRIRREQEDNWCRIEVEAQRQWRALQVKLAEAREERAKQNAKIKLEWEQEQKKLQELKEQKEKELLEKKKLQEQQTKEIDDFLISGGETPEHLKVTLETNPNKPICPFFQKTSACRFFDACSRNHIRPGVSHIIVIPNFYTHYSLEKTSENEHGSDNSLEFEKHETYNHFKEFFYDVVYEMEKYGRILIFHVCCNHESHLRGNVFVEYETTRSALKSFKTFNGRWYGGKQLNVEFCAFESWKKAICGLHFSNRCPKGSACNFLHVFRNPKNLYSYDFFKREQEKTDNELNKKKYWRWSESPERITDPNKHSSKRSRSRKIRHSRSRSRRKRSRSRSTKSRSSRSYRSNSSKRRS
ncbi:unnamed protein product [Brassicogethes aeneus]|uniref:Uncharacterized protein n=1 Tax=Brassicogethes aeneus TaxID=1431903 RepID=A0A9P0FHA2_BRAAE|nr:unnamed protein product [Brassicogethes aeneus]